VPDEILIVFVAKLRLYGFWLAEGLFAELLRILEKDGATGLFAKLVEQFRERWRDAYERRMLAKAVCQIS
jgi:hypothetical protein